ncbi:C2 DOMAIN-CONTAINING [Salix purpurea]|uniref:C2 DOMAIN-CONTAINING n=1 Tax=Salix purpurea TaxID=77065 RepID=A0A9Q0P160_SALPP|nr:C2 DOMAIN-CONTAINING [Salix purpurea]
MLSYSVEAKDGGVLVFFPPEPILSTWARIQGRQPVFSSKGKCCPTPKPAHYAGMIKSQGPVEEAEFAVTSPYNQKIGSTMRQMGICCEAQKMLVDDRILMEGAECSMLFPVHQSQQAPADPPEHVTIEKGSDIWSAGASSYESTRFLSAGHARRDAIPHQYSQREHLYTDEKRNPRSKDEKTWWNEKFRFDFPLTDWKQLTHLKFRIMDQELFTDGGFVGETIIYLGGIIDEGINRGVLEMMPAPYNVVLEDDTYKGEIKIGLRFTANTEVLPERTFLAQVDEPRQLTCRSIINLWKFSWWKFWVYQNQRNTKNKVEEE